MEKGFGRLSQCCKVSSHLRYHTAEARKPALSQKTCLCLQQKKTLSKAEWKVKQES